MIKCRPATKQQQQRRRRRRRQQQQRSISNATRTNKDLNNWSNWDSSSRKLAAAQQPTASHAVISADLTTSLLRALHRKKQ